MAQSFFDRFIIPLLVPVLIGAGAASITSLVFMGRMDERLSFVEMRVQKTEDRLETLRVKSAEHDMNNVRMEALARTLDAMQKDIRTLTKK